MNWFSKPTAIANTTEVLSPDAPSSPADDVSDDSNADRGGNSVPPELAPSSAASPAWTRRRIIGSSANSEVP